jgi:hypothetical protein
MLSISLLGCLDADRIDGAASHSYASSICQCRGDGVAVQKPVEGAPAQRRLPAVPAVSSSSIPRTPCGPLGLRLHQ